jgi:hypothetical protein
MKGDLSSGPFVFILTPIVFVVYVFSLLFSFIREIFKKKNRPA